jgi:plastocyanin
MPLPAGGTWPFTAALAVTLIMLGLVLEPVFAYFGLAVGVVTVVGWLARVSADTTGRQINLLPVGLPVLGLFCIASLMFFMSRILLAVPEQASTLIALMVALTILGLATLLALKPSISARTMVSVLGVAGVLMLAGGLVAAAAGERDIEAHHTGQEGHAPGAVEIKAKGIQFDLKEMALPANAEAEIVFKNEDMGIPHNLSVYGGPDNTAPPLLKGDIVAGPAEITYHFQTAAPGDLYFQCDVHPNMNGKAHVA